MNSIFLETKHLIIKNASQDDYENLCVLQSDPDVMRYIGNGARSPAEVQNALDNAMSHQKKHGFGIGMVFEKNTGLFIGWAGLIYLAYDDTQSEIEVGYMLHKAFWNKGYATELAKAIIKWGFENLPVDKLVAVIIPDNKGSRRVLEKSGMHYIGESVYRNKNVAKFEINKNSTGNPP
jgi:ribosomal-protein-alanine N-acetyltransferase